MEADTMISRSDHNYESMNSYKYKPKYSIPSIRKGFLKKSIMPSEPMSHAYTCVGCHDSLNSKLFAKTVCGHYLHVTCMINLLQESEKCPSCHRQISPSDWTAHHLPCFKTFGESELLWNDTHHLWLHKNCQFSDIELLELMPPKIFQSVFNVNTGPESTSANRVLDNFDKISISHNVSESNFFDEPISIAHKTIFEPALDDFFFKNPFEWDNLEESGDKDEDICKICNERFDCSHQPTTVTSCGHLLHTHCMNSYLPTAKECPICKHPINWVDATDKCVFCLEPFSWNGDLCVPLPCSHESHQNCHKLWMLTTNDCPLCKETIYSRDGCSECSKPVLPSQIKGVAPCGHEFHVKCSNKNMNIKGNCRKCIEIKNATAIDCSICLEQMERDVDSQMLPCKHEFHSTCVKRWTLHKTTCPLCRRNIN